MILSVPPYCWIPVGVVVGVVVAVLVGGLVLVGGAVVLVGGAVVVVLVGGAVAVGVVEVEVGGIVEVVLGWELQAIKARLNTSRTASRRYPFLIIVSSFSLGYAFIPGPFRHHRAVRWLD